MNIEEWWDLYNKTGLMFITNSLDEEIEKKEDMDTKEEYDFGDSFEEQLARKIHEDLEGKPKKEEPEDSSGWASLRGIPFTIKASTSVHTVNYPLMYGSAGMQVLNPHSHFLLQDAIDTAPPKTPSQILDESEKWVKDYQTVHGITHHSFQVDYCSECLYWSISHKAGEKNCECHACNAMKPMATSSAWDYLQKIKIKRSRINAGR